MKKVVLNEPEYEKDTARASVLAKSLLEGDQEYLDNILELNQIGNKIYTEVWNTEFHIFGVIASDTDHLPIQRVRSLCSTKMLEKSDLELEQIIKHYKLDVENACKEILSKYQSV